MTAFNPQAHSFSTWRYQAILSALQQEARDAYRRGEIPNLDPTSGFVGWELSRIALEGHRTSAAMDRVAQALSWESMSVRGEGVLLANMIGRPLEADAPATVDLVLTLAQVLTAPVQIVDTLARFSSLASKAEAAVSYEYLGEPITSLQNDRATAFPNLQMYAGGAWAPYVPGSDVWPAAGPPTAGDGLAIGHQDLMFSEVAITQAVAPAGYGQIVMEYCDEGYSAPPDTAAASGAGVLFNINTALGRIFTCAGLTITARCISTGASEDIVSTWAGPNNQLQTLTTLGQAVVSVAPEDYEIILTWCPIPGIVTTDAIGALAYNAEDLDAGVYYVAWDALQSADRKWVQAEINSVDGYWIRWRLVVAGAAVWTEPQISQPSGDYGLGRSTSWSTVLSATQGQTVRDSLGVTDDTAWQALRLGRAPYIEGSVSQVIVDADDGWSEADSSYDANSVQKAFVVTEDHNGARFIKFGDGTFGQIPLTAKPVVAVYRIGASTDGNLGAETVTEILQGSTYFAACSNPRAGTGWVPAEGSTPELLEVIRNTVPGEIRSLTRAVAREDFETLSERWKNADGGLPVARASAVEDSFGAKTIGLYVCGPAGEYVDLDDREALEEYYNGETIGLQKVGGVALGNTTTTCLNYTRSVINITVIVYVLSGQAEGVEDAVQAALQAAMLPTALNAAGQWRWWSGQDVAWAYIGNVAAQAAGPGLTDVDVTAPWPNVLLAASEWPYPGAITVTVVEN